MPQTRSIPVVTTPPPPPGWYPDPGGAPGVQRYWDGATWTQHTHSGPIGVPTPASPQSTSRSNWLPGSALASYGRRMGGWLIDWVIVGVVSTIVLLPAGGFLHSSNTADANGLTTHSVSFGVSGWGFVVSALLVIGYGTLLCGSRRGQTLGMMAVRVRAVDPVAFSPIGYGRAFGRALLEYVFALVFFLPWVIDMLWPLWDSQNQTLHDKASRTIVIRG